MALRLFSQHIGTEERPWNPDGGYKKILAGVGRVYRKVLRPDTVVEQRCLPRSTYYTSHAWLEMLNNAEIVRGVIDAENEGFDAALVCCGNDAGVYQAREAVRMPVVGIAEATMHLACQLGSRFALIGVDAKSGALVERNLRLSGLEGRAISHRPVRMPEVSYWDSCLAEGEQWFESVDYVREKIVPAFDKVARACVEDGAEVICTACGMFGALTLADYNRVEGTEVPVLDCVAVGAKMAEMQGDLRRSLGISTSKQLSYGSLLTPEMRDRLAAPFFPGR